MSSCEKIYFATIGFIRRWGRIHWSPISLNSTFEIPSSARDLGGRIYVVSEGCLSDRQGSFLRANNDSVMSELIHSAEIIQKDIYKNMIINRKKLGLSWFDLSLFGYLFNLSRTRVFIKCTTAQLADDIQEPYQKVIVSIKKFVDLDFIRRVKYKEHSGIMISPLLINNGDRKKKAFKIQLWEKKAFMQKSHSYKGIHYPIKKDIHS